ncbi:MULTISPECIES: hypothetical protein [Halolamina]|uniref:hypothetical protein n=1 Tax=Halolamina TaxID=1075397 RepID=UPI001160613F|nr:MULTISPECIES: hypothetical protein [Halolamina]NHX36714.1 hypothetical protein [Halolamina sp. R1-12]
MNGGILSSKKDRETFTLVADGESYAPITPEHGYPVDLDVPGNAYAPENGDRRGWLLFETPAQLDSPPVLRLDDNDGPREWDLAVEKATAPPPAWEWAADAPAAVAPDETFEITIAAENVGDGPGTFRGAVNFSYPLYKPEGFDVPLDPGESGTATVTAEARDADPGREIDYGIRTPTGETTVTVAVEDGTATNTDAN